MLLFMIHISREIHCLIQSSQNGYPILNRRNSRFTISDNTGIVIDSNDSIDLSSVVLK